MNNLLQPLQVTAESADEYVRTIATRHTEQLHDDYQMIWLHLPDTGYGDLKPYITQIRLAIIAELPHRKAIAMRARLCDRLAAAEWAVTITPVLVEKSG
jgi:hypothetical protein